jgi:hypothetical protein
MKKIVWYFNNQAIKTFDFENNPTLNDDLYFKNGDGSFVNKESIIIDIFK